MSHRERLPKTIEALDIVHDSSEEKGVFDSDSEDIGARQIGFCSAPTKALGLLPERRGDPCQAVTSAARLLPSDRELKTRTKSLRAALHGELMLRGLARGFASRLIEPRELLGATRRLERQGLVSSDGLLCELEGLSGLAQAKRGDRREPIDEAALPRDRARGLER